ncbi:MAG TPA: 6-phosphogluconolactonase [Thermoleophilaceae bacterium]|nr:6-phosphogluconolactonase [Thermoleophilaceae bacterium]
MSAGDRQLRIEVGDDPAAGAARLLAEASGNVVLTGGSTPRQAYEQAASLRDDWAGVELWLSDERCVAPDHEHSNFGMIKRALLDRVEGAELHRMRAEQGPEQGADAYESELREVFGDSLPRFELMLLGLGPDAHMCSLFPGDPALGERERLAVGVDTPGMAPLVSRVTLTLPVVNEASKIVFLVTGEDKAEAVARAFSGAPDPGAPASLVKPRSGSLTLLLDPAAAARLDPAAATKLEGGR